MSYEKTSNLAKHASELWDRAQEEITREQERFDAYMRGESWATPPITVVHATVPESATVPDGFPSGPKKNDRLDHKLRWELLDLSLLEEVVKVYTAGADKYGENTWQQLPDGYRRYRAALMRHLTLFEQGEAVDPDTGCLHLAQVVWNALAMLYFHKTNQVQQPISFIQK